MMKTKDLIPADELCNYHRLETEFIELLKDEGLVQISIVNQQTFIPVDELQKVEAMIHLHRDLDINVAGIASINYLLHKLEELHAEIGQMKNRLRLYED